MSADAESSNDQATNTAEFADLPADVQERLLDVYGAAEVMTTDQRRAAVDLFSSAATLVELLAHAEEKDGPDATPGEASALWPAHLSLLALIDLLSMATREETLAGLREAS